jgi:hypothetical protein
MVHCSTVWVLVLCLDGSAAVSVWSALVPSDDVVIGRGVLCSCVSGCSLRVAVVML